MHKFPVGPTFPSGRPLEKPTNSAIKETIKKHLFTYLSILYYTSFLPFVTINLLVGLVRVGVSVCICMFYVIIILESHSHKMNM